jgi:EAL domain-containing protein (putative c-di-GMP-specific phosphodiesterase class I)
MRSFLEGEIPANHRFYTLVSKLGPLNELAGHLPIPDQHNATMGPSFLSATWERLREAPLLTRSFDAGAPASLHETRRQAPRLRPLAIGLVAASLAVGWTIVATALVASQLSGDLQRRLHSADEALNLVIDEIQSDLQAVSEYPPYVCDEALRENLARASLNSIMVREFMIQPTIESAACSVFGPIEAFWPQGQALNDRLHILPASRIRLGIIALLAKPDAITVATIEPRQLLDRLPPGSDFHTVKLKTEADQTLAVDGVTDTRQAIASIEHRLTRWPLVLEGSVHKDAVWPAVRQQLVAWVLLWVVSSALSVTAINIMIRKRASRATKLHQALRKRRFAPVVQPIVDAQSGRCLGVEVLMRWKHPQRGLVPPAEFIDYAERSGLIVPMSELLMKQAHSQLAGIARAYPELYFAFNITPTQLRADQFLQTLCSIFDGDPIGPSRVVLELTERDLVDDHVRLALVRLRSAGFRIAIDDFGTGQSSLALLQGLRVDMLKIDRAFVMTISETSDGQPVLDAIIEMAQRLRLALVGEGVETEAQETYLKSKQVFALQGYRYSRPVTAPEFVQWLAPNNSESREHFITDRDGLLVWFERLDQSRAALQRHRWHRLTRYKDCIEGRELVRWLCEQFDMSPSQAVKLGQRLVARGWLEHVHSEHDFSNSGLFYRLLPKAAPDESNQSRAVPAGLPSNWLGWLHGPQGVRPGVRRTGLIEAHEAVSGLEIIDALQRCGFSQREQAFAAAAHLMRLGQIRHVFDSRGLEDSRDQLYHFGH